MKGKRMIGKVIISIVLLFLVLMFFWPSDDEEVGIRIYITKGETGEVPKEYRAFGKELIREIREYSDIFELGGAYSVYIKYEKGSFTQSGGLEDRWAVSLYVEDKGPLDWVFIEELTNEGCMKQRAKDFAFEALVFIFNFETETAEKLKGEEI